MLGDAYTNAEDLYSHSKYYKHTEFKFSNKIIATFRESGWNACNSYYAIVEFKDKSVLIVDLDGYSYKLGDSIGDGVEDIHTMYSDDIVKGYKTIDCVLEDIQTWGYEELGYIAEFKSIKRG